MKVLVTGGAGYIGSHTVIKLIEHKHEPIIVDNLCNSSKEVLNRIKEITGISVPFYEADVCDEKSLSKIFSENKIDCVIHFAGLKAVGESVGIPLKYYANNLNSTLALCKVMDKFNCKKIIFSSSATVYSSDSKMPVDEEAKKSCTNPYGWTKYMCEQILSDLYKSDKTWSIILLRYFNPIGAHKSGIIGEEPNGIPNNLVPYITNVAIGKLEKLHVFGNDYPTKDGSCIRDYIHVEDLAEGHINAMNYIENRFCLEAVNLGTGIGYSVFDIINAFEKVNNVKIPYIIDGRRAGDLAETYSNPKKAEKLLGWKAKNTLEDMCRDSWNWQSKNPNGYK